MAVPDDHPAVLSGVDNKTESNKIEQTMSELHISITAKEIAVTTSQVKAEAGNPDFRVWDNEWYFLM